MEPGSRDKSEARRSATVRCRGSEKRWKNDEECIAETRPLRGFKEVRVRNVGVGVLSVVESVA